MCIYIYIHVYVPLRLPRGVDGRHEDLVEVQPGQRVELCDHLLPRLPATDLEVEMLQYSIAYT